MHTYHQTFREVSQMSEVHQAYLVLLNIVAIALFQSYQLGVFGFMRLSFGRSLKELAGRLVRELELLNEVNKGGATQQYSATND